MAQIENERNRRESHAHTHTHAMHLTESVWSKLYKFHIRIYVQAYARVKAHSARLRKRVSHGSMLRRNYLGHTDFLFSRPPKTEIHKILWKQRKRGKNPYKLPSPWQDRIVVCVRAFCM